MPGCQASRGFLPESPNPLIKLTQQPEIGQKMRIPTDISMS